MSFLLVFFTRAKYIMVVIRNIIPIAKFEYSPFNLYPLNERTVKTKKVTVIRTNILLITFSNFGKFHFVNWGIQFSPITIKTNITSTVIIQMNGNVFRNCVQAGFLPPMFMGRTELSTTAKLSTEHETLPVANVLLCTVFTLNLPLSSRWK